MLHRPEPTVDDSEQQREQQTEKQTEERIQQDPQLQQALETSSRIADLLLKNEQEELQRVSSYAQQLIDHEYRAPAREMLCKAEQAACLSCYQQHPDVRSATSGHVFVTCLQVYMCFTKHPQA